MEEKAARDRERDLQTILGEYRHRIRRLKDVELYYANTVDKLDTVISSFAQEREKISSDRNLKDEVKKELLRSIQELNDEALLKRNELAKKYEFDNVKLLYLLNFNPILYLSLKSLDFSTADYPTSPSVPFSTRIKSKS